MNSSSCKNYFDHFIFSFSVLYIALLQYECNKEQIIVAMVSVEIISFYWTENSYADILTYMIFSSYRKCNLLFNFIFCITYAFFWFAIESVARKCVIMVTKHTVTV